MALDPIFYQRATTTNLGMLDGIQIIRPDRTTNPYAANNQLSFASSSVQDYPAGTGIGSVTIYGIVEYGSGNYRAFRETAVAQGTTSVQVTCTCPGPIVHDLGRTHRVYYAEAAPDSYSPTNNGANVGTITIKVGATSVLTIPAGRGKSEAAIWSSATDQIGHLTKWQVSLTEQTGEPKVVLNLWKRTYGGPWSIIASGYVSSNARRYDDAFSEPGYVLEGNCDLKLTAEASQGNASLTAGLDIYRISGTY